MGHCVAIGHGAEAIGEHCVAIGDGVTVIEQPSGVVEIAVEDGLIIGDRVAFGPTLFGQHCNLRDLVAPYVEGRSALS